LSIAERVWKDGSEFLVPVMTPNLLSPANFKNQPNLVDEVQASIRSASRDGIGSAQRAMATRLDQTETLRNLKVPSLWLAGEEDLIIPLQEARDYAQLNPLIHLEVIEKTGHLIPMEAPEAFQKYLNAFVQV
jgi:pimeloyl-ACP methyl ester carboxylesterase